MQLLNLMLCSHSYVMGNLFFAAGMNLLVAFAKEPWTPSTGFLYVVLVVGALFLAGVALSALTFYEDHYWGDEDFRDELRVNASRKQT